MTIYFMQAIFSKLLIRCPTLKMTIRKNLAGPSHCKVAMRKRRSSEELGLGLSDAICISDLHRCCHPNDIVFWGLIVPFLSIEHFNLNMVSEEYKLVPDTLYLMIYFIDQFLSQNYIERQKLQLLGVTCMLIAS
ncbi:G2/mitotic-specific cyclin-2-like [Magnolia sinica]|uniref:G2/mitotic-specific cyclin-2-like n=1 Tax=Magnolia sinica TaxID=86752 RepID=UPI00265B6A0D|nr:G2/mitotic-specific cyclin-2-like [Magnolia sinica]